MKVKAYVGGATRSFGAAALTISRGENQVVRLRLSRAVARLVRNAKHVNAVVVVRQLDSAGHVHPEHLHLRIVLS
jgi:hypothetical protein